MDLISKIANLLNFYPKRAKDVLSKYGDQKIKSLQIVRTPIQDAIDKALTVLSLGAFKTKNPYDKMFHLYMLATLEDGTRVVIEKNQTVNIATDIPTETKETEKTTVSAGGITLNKLLNNTINKVGKSKFFQYSAFKNNCQQFVLDILESNGLSNQSIKEFVKQDVDELAKELGYLDKLANTVTDIAKIGDVARQQLGFKQGGKVSRPKIRSPFSH